MLWVSGKADAALALGLDLAAAAAVPLLLQRLRDEFVALCCDRHPITVPHPLRNTTSLR